MFWSRYAYALQLIQCYKTTSGISLQWLIFNVRLAKA